jgi:ABC-2 type transport system ATP-binding protein
MLEANDLTKRYGARTVLDRLNLAVAPGEIFCLLGPNGAGKTTTLHLFLGFTQPTAGQARVKGLDVARHPLETKKSVAYIPEQVALYKTLSGEENLRFFAELSGVPRARLDVGALCAEVGLEPHAIGRRVETYSMGMRQKVAIATALATGADIFLLDEPTSGLDHTAANEFSRLLLRLRDSGAAVLMATHDLHRARTVGTRIGVMCEGRLQTTVAAEDVSGTELESIYVEVTSGVLEQPPLQGAIRNQEA